MEQIEQILRQSPDAYELNVFRIWHNWCREKTTNETQLQKVMICQPLFNWWYRELQKYEVKFVKNLPPYHTEIPQKVLVEMYAEFTVEIFDRFSEPLITKALK